MARHLRASIEGNGIKPELVGWISARSCANGRIFRVATRARLTPDSTVQGARPKLGASRPKEDEGGVGTDGGTHLKKRRVAIRVWVNILDRGAQVQTLAHQCLVLAD